MNEAAVNGMQLEKCIVKLIEGYFYMHDRLSCTILCSSQFYLRMASKTQLLFSDVITVFNVFHLISEICNVVNKRCMFFNYECICIRRF